MISGSNSLFLLLELYLVLQPVLSPSMKGMPVCPHADKLRPHLLPTEAEERASSQKHFSFHRQQKNKIQVPVVP